MTTIITRLMPDQATAESAVDRLLFKGVPKRACDVITAGEDAAQRMERATVHPSAIDAYGKALAAGLAVVVVRTTYKPLGAAQLTRDILDGRGALDAGAVTDDYFAPSQPDKSPSILKDHPHILSLPVPGPKGPITPEFGVPLLKAHRSKRSVMAGGRRMSRAFWPMKLISTKTRKSSVISGGRYMSRAFWPQKLLSTKPRRKSVIPGGGFPFSRLFGARTVS
ncbi:hypothetical protein AB3Y40_03210 [Yoonia sp. R2331]|uniref:hypothetical protein n=1 Tax=Yoonia sp. R2331 TaxID=3237238 RepID=UPI0034E59045